MRPVTTRLPDDTYRILEEQADEDDRSISELVREHVEKGLEYDDLKRENERLQRQLTAANSRYEEHTELVRFAEEQRELDQRRKEREDAPVWTRAKWWVLGRD